MGQEVATTDAAACRPLRRDAVRNRELILGTAAVVFAEHGVDAGYDEIARRAGVGVGTVYRRFPERGALVRALFESRMNEILSIAGAAEQLADPWDALVTFLEGTIEHQAADRGLRQVLASSLSADEYQVIGRERLGAALARMVDRAQSAGDVRGDVGATDIGVQLMLISSLACAEQPQLWRRYLALLLDGIRPHPDSAPLPGAPPTQDAVSTLMRNLRDR